jgi:hypothetical protein
MSENHDQHPDTTVWDLYEKKAKIRDDELIDDWNGTLSNLPVFVSIITGLLPEPTETY